MKINTFLNLSLIIFILVIFQSCSTSYKTLLHEKSKTEICYINLTSFRKKTTQAIVFFYQSSTPKFQRFHFILFKDKCNLLVKVNPGASDKRADYFILDNLDDFDIPLSKKDAYLLNKLSPIIDSLHFCQSNQIMNAKGFKITTKEKVEQLLNF